MPKSLDASGSFTPKRSSPVMVVMHFFLFRVLRSSTTSGAAFFFFPDLLGLGGSAAAGGAMPAVLNAANEVAVARFLAGDLGFLDIARVVEHGMAAAGAAAFAYTGGSVARPVGMYAINVFVTFLLSTASMALRALRRRDRPGWVRELAPHALATAMCAVILVVTVVEKWSSDTAGRARSGASMPRSCGV